MLWVAFADVAVRDYLRNRIMGLLPSSLPGLRGDGPNAQFVYDVAPLQEEDDDQPAHLSPYLSLYWRGAADLRKFSKK